MCRFRAACTHTCRLSVPSRPNTFSSQLRSKGCCLSCRSGIIVQRIWSRVLLEAWVARVALSVLVNFNVSQHNLTSVHFMAAAFAHDFLLVSHQLRVKWHHLCIAARCESPHRCFGCRGEAEAQLDAEPPRRISRGCFPARAIPALRLTLTQAAGT